MDKYTEFIEQKRKLRAKYEEVIEALTALADKPMSKRKKDLLAMEKRLDFESRKLIERYRVPISNRKVFIIQSNAELQERHLCDLIDMEVKPSIFKTTRSVPL